MSCRVDGVGTARSRQEGGAHCAAHSSGRGVDAGSRSLAGVEAGACKWQCAFQICGVCVAMATKGFQGGSHAYICSLRTVSSAGGPLCPLSALSIVSNIQHSTVPAHRQSVASQSAGSSHRQTIDGTSQLTTRRRRCGRVLRRVPDPANIYVQHMGTHTRTHTHTHTHRERERDTE